MSIDGLKVPDMKQRIDGDDFWWPHFFVFWIGRATFCNTCGEATPLHIMRGMHMGNHSMKQQSAAASIAESSTINPNHLLASIFPFSVWEDSLCLKCLKHDGEYTRGLSQPSAALAVKIGWGVVVLWLIEIFSGC